MTYEDYLYHHGIKGQKWGIRRFQNEDGSYTEAGNKKRRIGFKRKMKGNLDDISDKELARLVKRKENENKYNKLYESKEKETYKDEIEALNNVNSMSRELSKLNNRSLQKQKPTKKEPLDLSEMSDIELQRAIQRKINERTYNDLFNPPEPAKVSKGRQIYTDIIETIGPLTALTASVLSVAAFFKDK
jgi:hypothetical protein